MLGCYWSLHCCRKKAECENILKKIKTLLKRVRATEWRRDSGTQRALTFPQGRQQQNSKSCRQQGVVHSHNGHTLWEQTQPGLEKKTQQQTKQINKKRNEIRNRKCWHENQLQLWNSYKTLQKSSQTIETKQIHWLEARQCMLFTFFQYVLAVGFPVRQKWKKNYFESNRLLILIEEMSSVNIL